MIGIIIDGISSMRIFSSVIREMSNKNAEFVLFCFDAHRGAKEYDRASPVNIEKAYPGLLDKAFDVVSITNKKLDILNYTKAKIDKLLNIEMSLSISRQYVEFKNKKIKLYSIQFLTDSMVHGIPSDIEEMNKVYYTTKHIMKSHLKAHNIQYNKNRDMALGSPLFDGINGNCEDNGILVLLPSIGPAEFRKTFGGDKIFLDTFREISKSNSVVFKTRKKHYVPPGLSGIGSILTDSDAQVKTLLNKYSKTIMFYSTGVYELVVGGSYVINIDVPIDGWTKDHKSLQIAKNYFAEDKFLNFDGVIQNTKLEDLTNIDFSKIKIITDAAEEWKDLFVGNYKDSAKNIVDDILKD